MRLFLSLKLKDIHLIKIVNHYLTIYFLSLIHAKMSKQGVTGLVQQEDTIAGSFYGTASLYCGFTFGLRLISHPFVCLMLIRFIYMSIFVYFR